MRKRITSVALAFSFTGLQAALSLTFTGTNTTESVGLPVGAPVSISLTINENPVLNDVTTSPRTMQWGSGTDLFSTFTMTGLSGTYNPLSNTNELFGNSVYYQRGVGFSDETQDYTKDMLVVEAYAVSPDTFGLTLGGEFLEYIQIIVTLPATGSLIQTETSLTDFLAARSGVHELVLPYPSAFYPGTVDIGHSFTTTSYLLDTLTISGAPVPEPAGVGMVFGVIAFGALWSRQRLRKLP